MTSQDLRLADYSATDTGIYYLLSSDTMHFSPFSGTFSTICDPSGTGCASGVGDDCYTVLRSYMKAIHDR